MTQSEDELLVVTDADRVPQGVKEVSQWRAAERDGEIRRRHRQTRQITANVEQVRITTRWSETSNNVTTLYRQAG